MILAVIDIGTNTFNLLIANRITKEIVYKDKQPVQLGKGGISKGFIATDAEERAIQTLLLYKSKIEQYENVETQVIATSAVRNANNREEFIKNIYAQTGFEIHVISGMVEAEGIHQGVTNCLALTEDAELILDIGGGSIEFIIANSEQPLWMKSLEIGGQRLMDQFHNQDPIANSDILKLNSFLEKTLDEVLNECKRHNVKSLIGSAGSFDTLQDMGKAADAIDETESHLLPVDYFQSICAELTVKPREERLIIPGMIALRVDMIVVATLLIKYIVDSLGIETIRVSSYSLKEGILFGNLEIAQF